MDDVWSEQAGRHRHEGTAPAPPPKVVASAQAALEGLQDGMRIMAGGFGLCGNAEHCIAEIARRHVKNLTIISNNCGNQGLGLAVLLKQRQVRKVICSFIGGNPDLEAQYLANEVEVELNPQGTLAERIRAAEQA
jgi:3-oxoacid CoA-transferase subunit A